MGYRVLKAWQASEDRKWPPTAAPAVLLLALSGCSAFNIGESDYGCPGRPEGVTCMSAREVYQATDNQISITNASVGRGAATSRPPAGERTAEGTQPSAQVTQQAPDAAPGPAGDGLGAMPVTAVLPDGSVPVRTPSHVMRIWMAAWETPNGDLVMPGYVYTEIVPRRWQVGLPSPDTQRVLQPLAVSRGQSSQP